MNPLVSIIVPTYNRADLIKDTIDSALAQTYKNIELIIADDGSTDNTNRIIKSFRDRRIKYIYLTHSGLPSRTRNRALEVTKGEFIAFLDSDDIWIDNKLEQSLSCFEEIDELGMVCNNQYTFKNKLECRNKYHNKYRKNELINFERLFMENIVNCSTALVRRVCLDEVGHFNESKDFRAVEDYHLWLRIAAQYPIYYIDEPLGYYRAHEGSIRLNTEESLINLYNTLMDIYKQFPDLIRPFYSSAMKRIQSVEMTILKLYIRRRKIWKSLGWFFKFFKSFALDIK